MRCFLYEFVCGTPKMSGLHGDSIVCMMTAMPPWENTPSQAFACRHCGATFAAKRPAKFCSKICQNRARPKRKPSPEKIRTGRMRRLAVPGYRERVNRMANERASRIRDWIDAYKLE